jgi:hypothetical protein
VAFANAFPQRFFDYVERHPSRLTVTTLSCLYAGVPLRRFHDLQRGEALSADITGEGWHTLGYPMLATIDPVDAGRRLVRLTREYTLVLFEYWKTDHAGHSQSMSEAVDVLERFDTLLDGVLSHADMRNTLVVLTSDHGNVEDLSTRSHTRHPVPLLAWGHRHNEFLREVERRGRRSGPDLTAVVPALLSLLGTHGAESVMP